MSDDLVKMARLAQHDERMSTGALYGDLADRIEALTKERDEAWRRAGHAEEQWGRCEAKLAKAMELANLVVEFSDRALWKVVKNTVLELKGEK